MACGEGIQTRTVECYHVADNAPVNESLCTQNISTPKPKTEKSCKGNTCIGEWLYDNWGKVCTEIYASHDTALMSTVVCSTSLL